MKFKNTKMRKLYKKMYPYQKKYCDKVLAKIKHHFEFIPSLPYKGKCILPTGAGKTVIMEYLQCALNNAFDDPVVGAIYCHRLTLIQNLAIRLLITRKNMGAFETTVVNVNSNDNTTFATEINNRGFNVHVFNNGWNTNFGTKHKNKTLVRLINISVIGNVKTFIEKEREAGRDVLFTALYQSMQKTVLDDDGNILTEEDLKEEREDLYEGMEKMMSANMTFHFAFYDEAHITTTTKFFDLLEKVENMFRVNLFFTATKTTDHPGYDMNNEDIYGEDDYVKHPYELVEGNYITPVKVVYLDAYDREDNKKNFDEAQTKRSDIHALMGFMDNLDKHVMEDSMKSGKCVTPRRALGFASVNGNKLLDDIKNNECKILNWAFKTHTYLFITSTKTKDENNNKRGGSFYYDYVTGQMREYNNKEEFMRDLLAVKNNERVLIININQLNEGMDLPGINGVLYLREPSCGLARYIQFIGRSIRRDDEDRIYAGDESVKWYDEDKFVKPCSYVYIVTNTFSEKDIERFEKIHEMLYKEYGKYIFKSLYKEVYLTEDMNETENPSQNKPTTFKFDIDSKVNIHKFVDSIVTLMKAVNNKEEGKSEDNKVIVKNIIKNIVAKTKEKWGEELYKKIGLRDGMTDIEMINKLQDYLVNN